MRGTAVSDRGQPPKGYRVYERGEHRLHKGRSYWLSRARLTSDGEHWTDEDAIAACWAHRDTIAAEVLREAAAECEAEADSLDASPIVDMPAFSGGIRSSAERLRERAAAIEAGAPQEQQLGPEWRPCRKRPVVVHVRDAVPGEEVFTREGLTLAKADDLVMRGVDGEVYPIGRDLFARTYDLLGAPQESPGGPTGEPEDGGRHDA